MCELFLFCQILSHANVAVVHVHILVSVLHLYRLQLLNLAKIYGIYGPI